MTKQRKGNLISICYILIIAMVLSNFLPISVKAADVITFAPVFNSSYYSARYADVKAAFGTDEKALFKHFLNCGMKEGRQASEEFNVQAYKKRYADLQAAFGDDLKAYYLHYISYGKAEGRNGKPEEIQPKKLQVDVNSLQQTNIQPQQNEISSEIAEVVRLVNQDRAANGLAPLTTTPELLKAADVRGKEIESSFSHTRPNGTSCITVLGECSVPYGYAGENIAFGYLSAAAVEEGWMNSPGHRSNILNANYKKIGVGLYKADNTHKWYWVQLFTD